MNKKSISELISATVFIPPSSNIAINFIRRTAKSFFRFAGKILSLFL